MEYLKSILKRLEHKVEHNMEEILVGEHLLNIAPKSNKLFYDVLSTNKNIAMIHELSQIDKYLAVAIEHLHNSKEIRDKKSLTDIIHVALSPYDNRTIHIENNNPNYPEMINMLESYKGVDFVSGYRHSLFEPLSIEMWEKHKPMPETRMVFYALDLENKGELKIKREKEAIEKAAGMLGTLATTKRKIYNQYAARTYKINENHNLSFVYEIASLTRQYSGDVWIRTDKREVNAKSVVSLLNLSPIPNKKIEVLCKPKEDAEKFYKEFESALVGNLLRKSD